MRRLATISALFLVLGPSAQVFASDSTQFVRITETDQGQPLAMQLAISSYAPRNDDRGVRVDLISAIHIGDESYYEELNDRFRRYDVLLYELIAPSDAIVSRQDSDRKGLISSTQIMMKNMLDLSFQLDEVDYTASNFVHADLTPEELSDSMDERGESLYVYFWRVFYAAMNDYAKDPLGLRDMEMLSAVLATESDNAFKIMLAYEMTNLDSHRKILGDDADSAVIGARNQRAIDVLKDQINAGKKRLAIFYGVAHMPDMESRLLDQLDLVYLHTTWIDAWSLGTYADK